MDVSLADRFVGMYVNDWTLDYGARGRAAVRKLLDEGHRAGIIPSPVEVGVQDGAFARIKRTWPPPSPTSRW